jgi:hypothetical protein
MSDTGADVQGTRVMVVHGSAVALYLGFLGLMALGRKRRARKSLEQVRGAGPCWVSRDS